jgi:hypothetical protein
MLIRSLGMSTNLSKDVGGRPSGGRGRLESKQRRHGVALDLP